MATEKQIALFERLYKTEWYKHNTAIRAKIDLIYPGANGRIYPNTLKFIPIPRMAELISLLMEASYGITSKVEPIEVVKEPKQVQLPVASKAPDNTKRKTALDSVQEVFRSSQYSYWNKPPTDNDRLYDDNFYPDFGNK